MPRSRRREHRHDKAPPPPGRARSYDGDLTGALRLDLADAAAPRQELALDMEAVQLSGLMQDLFRAGDVVEGTLRGTSTWAGVGSGDALRAQLRGRGNGLAVNGRLREQPLLTQLDTVLGLPSLARIDYGEFGFSFEIAAGQVQLPQLLLRGNDADASVQGRMACIAALERGDACARKRRQGFAAAQARPWRLDAPTVRLAWSPRAGAPRPLRRRRASHSPPASHQLAAPPVAPYTATLRRASLRRWLWRNS